MGNVINVQLIFTVDREYCYFALIAYKTENEAKDALNFFDKSYLYSSRIKVERCCEIGKYHNTLSFKLYIVLFVI